MQSEHGKGAVKETESSASLTNEARYRKFKRSLRHFGTCMVYYRIRIYLEEKYRKIDWKFHFRNGTRGALLDVFKRYFSSPVSIFESQGTAVKTIWLKNRKKRIKVSTKQKKGEPRFPHRKSVQLERGLEPSSALESSSQRFPNVQKRITTIQFF